MPLPATCRCLAWRLDIQLDERKPLAVFAAIPRHAHVMMSGCHMTHITKSMISESGLPCKLGPCELSLAKDLTSKTVRQTKCCHAHNNGPQLLICLATPSAVSVCSSEKQSTYGEVRFGGVLGPVRWGCSKSELSMGGSPSGHSKNASFLLCPNTTSAH